MNRELELVRDFLVRMGMNAENCGCFVSVKYAGRTWHIKEITYGHLGKRMPVGFSSDFEGGSVYADDIEASLSVDEGDKGTNIRFSGDFCDLELYSRIQVSEDEIAVFLPFFCRFFAVFLPIVSVAHHGSTELTRINLFSQVAEKWMKSG